MNAPVHANQILEGRERERAVSRDLMRRVVVHLKAGRTSDVAASTLELDPAVYTDPVRFEAERRELFGKLPLLACWSCDIPNPGDIHLFNDAGPSILIVRGEDGRARAFLNSCSHRMAELVSECSNRNRLICPFHGWMYNLSGELINIPGQGQAFPELDKRTRGLPSLPLAEWGGLIFVKAHHGEPDFDVEPFLGSLAPELKQLDLASCAPVGKSLVSVQSNWKVALDTYFEAYHFAALHPTTFGPSMITNMQLRDGFGPHERVLAVQRKCQDFADTPESDWPDLYYEGTHLIFPNTIFFVNQLPAKDDARHRPLYGAWRMFPGARHDQAFTSMQTYRAADAPAEDHAEYQANHDFIVQTVREEDYSVCAGIQRSMEASPPGRRIVLGRNESAVQAIERNIARAAGMPID